MARYGRIKHIECGNTNYIKFENVAARREFAKAFEAYHASHDHDGAVPVFEEINTADVKSFHTNGAPTWGDKYLTIDGYQANEILSYHRWDGVKRSYNEPRYRPPTSCISPLVVLEEENLRGDGPFVDSGTFERHALSAIFMDMPDADFENLLRSIETDGFIDNHIRIHEGKVLDGWHRYRAALELNIVRKLRFTVWDAEDEGSPEAFVMARNIERRHLTPGQRAQIVVTFNERFEHGTNRFTLESSQGDSKTRQELAKEAGVSTTSIDRAVQVEKAEESEAVISGKKTVNQVLYEMETLSGQTVSKGVYFLKNTSSGNIKIGFTNQLKPRISALQTATPDRLELLHVIPDGTQETESALHEKFSNLLLSGEWFQGAPVLEFVSEVISGEKSASDIIGEKSDPENEATDKADELTKKKDSAWKAREAMWDKFHENTEELVLERDWKETFTQAVHEAHPDWGDFEELPNPYGVDDPELWEARFDELTHEITSKHGWVEELLQKFTDGQEVDTLPDIVGVDSEIRTEFYNAFKVWDDSHSEQLERYRLLPVGRTPLTYDEAIQTYYEFQTPRIQPNTEPTAEHYAGAAKLMQERPVDFIKQLEGRHYRRIIEEWDNEVLPRLVERYAEHYWGQEKMPAEKLETRIRQAIRETYGFTGRISTQLFDVLFEITEDAHCVLIHLDPDDWQRNGNEIVWAKTLYAEFKQSANNASDQAAPQTAEEREANKLLKMKKQTAKLLWDTRKQASKDWMGETDNDLTTYTGLDELEKAFAKNNPSYAEAFKSGMQRTSATSFNIMWDKIVESDFALDDLQAEFRAVQTYAGDIRQWQRPDWSPDTNWILPIIEANKKKAKADTGSQKQQTEPTETESPIPDEPVEVDSPSLGEKTKTLKLQILEHLPTWKQHNPDTMYATLFHLCDARFRIEHGIPRGRSPFFFEELEDLFPLMKDNDPELADKVREILATDSSGVKSSDQEEVSVDKEDGDEPFYLVEFLSIGVKCEESDGTLRWSDLIYIGEDEGGDEADVSLDDLPDDLMRGLEDFLKGWFQDNEVLDEEESQE